MKYSDFLLSKGFRRLDSGILVNESDIHSMLIDFQNLIVRWAARKGAAAIFADCGLGKTYMQAEWARLIGGNCLIIAPLCVAKQTISLSAEMDAEITFCRDQSQMRPGINITNYEMVDKFEGCDIDAIVLDESSILKNLAGKTRKKLIEMFRDTKYKLCCTATPAPNDFTELGNHAEFLGIMTHAEMLASFFVNDPKAGGWRMKGFARESFYKWLASWAVAVNNPADLGCDGSAFNLPPINIKSHFVESGYIREGELFFMGMHGIQDRARIRKSTVDARIEAIVDKIETSHDQWICWCGLNDEANKLHSKLNGQSVNVQGSDSLESKEQKIQSFLNGDVRILISKPKICGHGMNFQNAANMVFVGLSDSYEAYYQCIRRSWRFGQKLPVNVHVVLADVEREIFDNVVKKESQAKEIKENLLANIIEFERMEMDQIKENNIDVETKTATGKTWELRIGDCVDEARKIDENHIDFSVYSPPFMSLYTYSATERDVGNCKNDVEFFEHYGYLIRELLRITKPGRNTAVHVSQVPAMLVRDGYIGLKDLRGRMVAEYEKAGWIYHGEIVIQKNPQAQAVRTKSKSLLFVQLKRDSSWLRPGLADYVLLFRKPGDNKVPILPDDISNEDWIKWAHPVWLDIRENNTLSKCEARADKDERHVCPLQLDVIDRCVRLWSNPGDLVFSPFAGIGSEGYQSILRGRRFLGVELKPEYAKVAVDNLRFAEAEVNQPTLFDQPEAK